MPIPSTPHRPTAGHGTTDFRDPKAMPKGAFVLRNPVMAYPWFRNGDHPDDDVYRPFEDTGEIPDQPREGAVVRYFRHPSSPAKCERCGKSSNVHGWIDSGMSGIKVCPGDYVYRIAIEDSWDRMSQIDFALLFTPNHPDLMVPCHCGTADHTPHETGEDGCVRRVVDAPKPAPSHPSLGCRMWEVDGQTITDFTLRQQRGYSHHGYGVWTCVPGLSENSVGTYSHPPTKPSIPIPHERQT